MDFTAIDFETANSTRSSICSIGLVRVENNEIVAEINQLINPSAPFNHYNTVVHSITYFDVRDAPSFADFFPQIQPFLQDNVVAHNAPFDISCLRSALQRYDINTPDFNYFCTLAMAKKNLDLKCNKLDFLANYFNLGSFNHHNAIEDARICAEIFKIFSKKYDTQPFAKSFLAQPKKSTPAKKSKFQILQDNMKLAQKANVAKLTTLKSKIVFDDSPVDFSKNFFVNCKTNNLSTNDIKSLILKQNGQISNDIDFLTNYIVIDDLDPFNPPSDSQIDVIYQALCYPNISFININSLISSVF